MTPHGPALAAARTHGRGDGHASKEAAMKG